MLNVPKGPCVEGLLARLWYNWEVVAPLEEGLEITGVVPLKRILGLWLPPVSLSLSLLPGHLACFMTHSLSWCSASPQARKQWNNQPWNEISKTGSENKAFLFINLSSQVFCHSNRKLTNTRILDTDELLCFKECGVEIWSPKKLLPCFHERNEPEDESDTSRRTQLRGSQINGAWSWSNHAWNPSTWGFSSFIGF
jgi:hypothetical protein